MNAPYRERDYTYGASMLALRTAMGLTQEGLAHRLGISRRAVGEWEMGSSYPKVQNLKQLIALAVELQVFPVGQEAEEIRMLWQVTHQKVLLNESWLSALLKQRHSSHLHVVPPPSEENMPIGTVPRACSPTPTENMPIGTVPRACPPTPTENIPVGTVPRACPPTPTASGPKVDWGEALALPTFYGREQEQAMLTQWLVQDRCQVVSVLGMGGIGKSTLAINTMYRLAAGTAACPCPFDVIFFRSLHEAPSCEALLAECLQVFSPQDRMPTGHALGTVPTGQRLNLLLSHLRRVRALVVLDNLECLLAEMDTRGHFRPGFEGYGWFLRRVAETAHQSCLLLTSREKPANLRYLEGKYSPVRSLRLAGLDTTACQQIIEERGVIGDQQEQEQLIKAYSGNPLALRIVGETIVDLFGGEIRQFLASKAPVAFGSIADLLDEQFVRLSHLERTVLYWLAIMREPVTFDELLKLLPYPLPFVRILEAVDGLRQRSLIEGGTCPGSFTLQSVVLEYVTAVFIAEVSSEIQQHRLDLLIQHSLSLFQTCEAIGQKQEGLLLCPLLAHLQSIYPRRTELEGQLLSLIDELRGWTDSAQGYGPANLIALLRLQRGHLSGLDLSHLSLHQ